MDPLYVADWQITANCKAALGGESSLINPAFQFNIMIFLFLKMLKLNDNQNYYRGNSVQKGIIGWIDIKHASSVLFLSEKEPSLPFQLHVDGLN